MFTLPFWIIFGTALLASLAVSIAYGRRAIHPRLRPHFGLVVIVFVVLALISFFVASLLARLVEPDPANTNPQTPAAKPAAAESPAEPPSEPASKPASEPPSEPPSEPASAPPAEPERTAP